MTGTSRARTSEASLYVVEHVVEPNPHQPEFQEPPTKEPSPTPAQEPTPAADSEVPQPDSAGGAQADDPGLDARSSGMALLLRLALRLMKSYGDTPPASPARRDRMR
jgi:hypothetical protein